MKPLMRVTAVLLSALGGTPQISEAQETISGETAEANERGNSVFAGFIDVSVPESPAFTVLDLSPDNVVRPADPRELAVTLLNGSDANGNLQTGLAIDTAPYFTFFGENVTLWNYRNSLIERLATNSQFSLAIAKGTDDDEAARLALGYRLTPWNLGDPRLGDPKNPEDSLIGCFIDRLQSNFETLAEKKADLEIIKFDAETKRKEIDKETDADRKAQLRQDLNALQQQVTDAEAQIGILDANQKSGDLEQQCRDQAKARDWNASSWTLGFAPTWTSPSGSTDDLEWSGVGLYSSVAYGFEHLQGLKDAAQLIGHVRYRGNELVPDPDEENTFIEQDSLTLGLQLRLAGPNIASRDITGGSDLNFILDLAYIDEDRKDRADEEVFRYAAGAEYEVAEDSYLKLTLGFDDGRDDDEDQLLVLAGLKFGFSTQPSFNFRPR